MSNLKIYPTIPLKRKYWLLIAIGGVLFLGMLMNPLNIAQADPPMERLTQDNVTPIISAGSYHTCWLKPTGELACWGANQRKQIDVPEGSYIQVDAGGYHTCALKADRTIVCWGATPDEKNIPPGGNFVQVSSGTHNNCALQEDGTVLCWGANWYGGQAATLVCPGEGQLKQRLCGEGNNYAAVPFTYISVGEEFHTCGILKTNNTAVCWRFDPKQPNRIFPEGEQGRYYQQLPYENVFSQMSAGGFHTCGLKPDGTTLCWANEGRIYQDIDEINLAKKIDIDKIDVAQISVERDPTGRVTKIIKTKNKYQDDVDPTKVRKYKIDMDQNENKEVVNIKITNQCGERTINIINPTTADIKEEDKGEKVDNVCVQRDLADKNKRIIQLKINKTYGLCDVAKPQLSGRVCSNVPSSAFDQQCKGNERFCNKCETVTPCDSVASEEIIDVRKDVDKTYELCKDNDPGCINEIKITKAVDQRRSSKSCQTANYVQKDEFGRTVIVRLECNESRTFDARDRYTDTLEFWRDNGKIKTIRLTKKYSVQTLDTSKMNIMDLRVVWIDERGRTFTTYGGELPKITVSPKPEILQVQQITLIKECAIKEQIVEERDVRKEGDVSVKVEAVIDTEGQVIAACRKKCRGTCKQSYSFPEGVTEKDCLVGVKITTLNSWGNYFYQASPPTVPFKQVVAGGFHSCGLRPDGSVTCWGTNNYGQANTPVCPTQEELDRQKQACGDSDGCPEHQKLFRQCQGGQGNVLFSQITAGAFHTCGLLQADNSPFCWGSSTAGQSTPPYP